MKPWMLALLLGLTGGPATAAHHEDLRINSATELRDWCRDESQAVLAGRGLAPANWTASYWDQENVLMVRGKWRVADGEVTVDCSVARGAEARFASVSIQDAG